MPRSRALPGFPRATPAAPLNASVRELFVWEQRRPQNKSKKRASKLWVRHWESMFHALWQEVAWLHSKWTEYIELFGSKPSRVKLLNNAAPNFFRIVQDALWEGTLLHIARLTDSPKSAGKHNLTIRQLPELLKDDELRDSVKQLIVTAVEASAFARDWRNRRIAHRDLELAIEKGIRPLERANGEKVEMALDSISAVLNAVSLHYQNSTTIFDAGGSHNGAVNLLYVIDDGLKADAERRMRMGRGNYREEDHGPRGI